MSTDGPFGRRPDLPPEVPDPEPAPPQHRPGPPRPPAGLASPATWIAGIAIVVLLALVTLNTIRTKGPGSQSVALGAKLPPFAAPLALANLKCKGEDCDASVLVKAHGGSRPACEVRGPKVLNSCQLAERGPSVIGFLVGPSQRCIDQIDQLDRLRTRFPDVQFAAVAIKGDHADVNRIIRRHGWKLPVGYDRDGAIANAFAIAVCPTVIFARSGGEVGAKTIGSATDRELIADIREVRARVPRGAARRTP